MVLKQGMKTNTSASCIAQPIFSVEGDMLSSLLVLSVFSSNSNVTYSINILIFSMDFFPMYLDHFLYDKLNETKLRDIFKCVRN